jgi:hypothetical protein
MNNEQPHSGSRWEPTTSTGEAIDGADDATERVAPPAARADPAGDKNHEAAPADERPDAAGNPDGDTATDRIATPAAHDAPGPGVFPAVPVGASPKPHRNRRRAGVLAAVAAGLLALGGVGGYAIGRTAAPDGPPAGLAGATGEYGHHRGPSGTDGGFGDRDGDGPVGDGSVDDGSAGTAPGGTGSSGTGTGSST